MSESSLYFSNNLFSAGKTEILTETKEVVGELDLKSMFSSGVDVLDANGNIVMKGSFKFMSSKWITKDKNDQEIGLLKKPFFSIGKKYVYTSYQYGEYYIESAAFSKDYTVLNQQNEQVATFKKVSGFMQSSAYQLQNFSPNLSDEELIVVVMGVNMITRRRRNAANNSAAT
ncbi:hypothetical protein GCM10011351_07660 [Paraliobacillus quinghaiensis]|uniref:Uncharacterized protein n=1 Tax=Paraliobacillus quinghaiensis TaxID=470815 RepID=A0A917WSA8_9BACI|nr:hypothetical protein [Paraliobacillus quinghaiensis]GGM24368.1 hypothetical protein GCM10011351_07660 [Paraliobacillus quinghaiensis]